MFYTSAYIKMVNHFLKTLMKYFCVNLIFEININYTSLIFRLVVPNPPIVSSDAAKYTIFVIFPLVLTTILSLIQSLSVFQSYKHYRKYFQPPIEREERNTMFQFIYEHISFWHFVTVSVSPFLRQPVSQEQITIIRRDSITAQCFPIDNAWKIGHYPIKRSQQMLTGTINIQFTVYTDDRVRNGSRQPLPRMAVILYKTCSLQYLSLGTKTLEGPNMSARFFTLFYGFRL